MFRKLCLEKLFVNVQIESHVVRTLFFGLQVKIGSFLTFDFLLRKVLIELLLFSKIRCLSLMFGLTSWFSI